jgi:hypothetical protein
VRTSCPADAFAERTFAHTPDATPDMHELHAKDATVIERSGVRVV